MRSFLFSHRGSICALACTVWLAACGGGGSSIEGSDPAGAAPSGSQEHSPGHDGEAASGAPGATGPNIARTDQPTDALQGAAAEPSTDPAGHDAIGAEEATPPPVPAGAAPGTFGAVTFDEEWDGPLDTRKWHTRMPHWNAGIPDLDNWKIESGQLKIWTPRMDDGQFLFENRAMVTYDKFSQRYGWFEMEARLPPGKGLWPSFWLYGIYGTDRPEIDIMESHGGVDQWWGDPNPIDYGATVWLGQLDGNHELIGMARPTDVGITPGDLTLGFHKYGALWEPDGITFFFDGKQIGDKIHTSQMNRELWIIVGLGTGRPGDYNGPTSRTPTNSEYVINYVRAWALPGGVTTVNGRTVD